MAKTRTASPAPVAADAAPSVESAAAAPVATPDPGRFPVAPRPPSPPGGSGRVLTGDPMEDLPDDPTPEQLRAAIAASAGEPVEDDDAPPAADGGDDAPPPADAPSADSDAEPPAVDAAGTAYPDWIEEKYRTGRTVAQAVEAQAKGYAEARKALHARAADLKVKPGEAPKPDAAPEPWKELDQTTMRVIGEEFLAKGDLSPETYKRIQETFKIPPAQARVLVEQGIERQGAENLRIIEDAGFADLGAFQAVVQWASAAVPKADLEAINALLDGPGATRITRAAGVRMLRDLHAKANPPAPKRRLAGASGSDPAMKPITSQAEYTQELERIHEKWSEVPERLAREIKVLNARADAGRVSS